MIFENSLSLDLPPVQHPRDTEVLTPMEKLEVLSQKIEDNMDKNEGSSKEKDSDRNSQSG